MREFQLPLRPEELLEDPGDGRLWARDLPPVGSWRAAQIDSEVSSLSKAVASSHGFHLVEDASFSLIFALLQAWMHLEEGTCRSLVDALMDSARCLGEEVARMKAAEQKKSSNKQRPAATVADARIATKVCIFFLRWAAERVHNSEKSQQAGSEGQAVAQRARRAILTKMMGMLTDEDPPFQWLWAGDEAAFQQAVGALQRCPDSASMDQLLNERNPKPRGPVSLVQDLEGNAIADAIVSRLKRARDALELEGDIIPFGSHVNGLRTSTSDCDLSYMPDEALKKPILVLQRFAAELPKHGFYGIITVFQASVPLVKAVDPSGVEVDLCVGNQLGVRNSKLVAAYCSLDPRVGEVGRLVKQWAKSLELVGSSDGHLNSYAYTLLTLFYLMKRSPPVIPNLQDLAIQLQCDKVIINDRRWGHDIAWDCRFWDEIHLLPRSQNSESVEQLLRGFFDYYANGAFDWRNHAVSVRMAMTTTGPVKDIDKFHLYSHVQQDQWYIEDPFDQRHNLASQCSKQGRTRILEKMKEALSHISDAKNVLAGFDAHISKCRSSSCIMKCRIHVEKVTKEQFIKTFDHVGVGRFTVQFPAGLSRNAGEDVREAFLVFTSENDRRRVHKLNETYVGEWQLRFLPCSSWALQDAKRLGMLEELEVSPSAHQAEEAEKSFEDVCEEVRRGLRVAQSKGEHDVLVQRAQALSIPWEDLSADAGAGWPEKHPPGGVNLVTSVTAGAAAAAGESAQESTLFQ